MGSKGLNKQELIALLSTVCKLIQESSWDMPMFSELKFSLQVLLWLSLNGGGSGVMVGRCVGQACLLVMFFRASLLIPWDSVFLAATQSLVGLLWQLENVFVKQLT